MYYLLSKQNYELNIIIILCREPILILSKLFRGYALRQLPTALELSAATLENLDPSSFAYALIPLLRHSVQFFIYSLAYRLVSIRQRFVMLCIAILPLFPGEKLTCTAFAGHDHANWTTFGHFAKLLIDYMHPLLPVVLWSELDQVQPCVLFCAWALLIFGYFLPLSLGLVWEERSRLEFLLVNRFGALSPPILIISLLHALVLVVLASSIFALGLDAVTTFSTAMQM